MAMVSCPSLLLEFHFDLVSKALMWECMNGNDTINPGFFLLSFPSIIPAAAAPAKADRKCRRGYIPQA